MGVTSRGPSSGGVGAGPGSRQVQLQGCLLGKYVDRAGPRSLVCRARVSRYDACGQRGSAPCRGILACCLQTRAPTPLQYKTTACRASSSAPDAPDAGDGAGGGVGGSGGTGGDGESEKNGNDEGGSGGSRRPARPTFISAPRKDGSAPSGATLVAHALRIVCPTLLLAAALELCEWSPRQLRRDVERLRRLVREVFATMVSLRGETPGEGTAGASSATSTLRLARPSPGGVRVVGSLSTLVEASPDLWRLMRSSAGEALEALGQGRFGSPGESARLLDRRPLATVEVASQAAGSTGRLSLSACAGEEAYQALGERAHGSGRRFLEVGPREESSRAQHLPLRLSRAAYEHRLSPRLRAVLSLAGARAQDAAFTLNPLAGRGLTRALRWGSPFHARERGRGAALALDGDRAWLAAGVYLDEVAYVSSDEPSTPGVLAARPPPSWEPRPCGLAQVAWAPQPDLSVGLSLALERSGWRGPLALSRPRLEGALTAALRLGGAAVGHAWICGDRGTEGAGQDGKGRGPPEWALAVGAPPASAGPGAGWALALGCVHGGRASVLLSNAPGANEQGLRRLEIAAAAPSAPALDGGPNFLEASWGVPLAGGLLVTPGVVITRENRRLGGGVLCNLSCRF